METFRIFEYSTAPSVVTIPPVPETDIDWMCHMGKDVSLMLRRAVEWAFAHAASGEVKEAFETFFKYARANFMTPSQTSVFMKISVEMKTDEWKVPRIHHDGIYWDTELNEEKERYKIGTVLCGPGTLFWDTSKVSLEVAKKAQEIVGSGMQAKATELGTPEDNDSNEVRTWAKEELNKLGIPVVSAKPSECVRWLVADEERAAVHAEPDMSNMIEGRLFVSLMPGTEAQIRNLAAAWEKPFEEFEEEEKVVDE